MKVINDLKRCNSIVGVILATLLCSPIVHAVPANNKAYTIKQPDGSKISVRKRGDERRSWVETLSGHPIAKDVDGSWRYIQGFKNKVPMLSGVRAAQATPSQITSAQKKVRPPLDTVRPIDTVPSFDDSQLRTGPLNPSVLIILLEYQDTPATYTDVSSWSAKIKSSNSNAKTIADYYKQASYGQVSVTKAREIHGATNDGVVGWLRVNKNHPVNRPISSSADMGAESDEIANDAIEAADPYINFADYDQNNDFFIDSTELAIVIVVAGHEAATSPSGLPAVWAHADLNVGIIQTDDEVTVTECEQVCEDVPANLTSKPGYIGPMKICHQDCSDRNYAISLSSVVEMGEIHESNHQATLGPMVHELGHLIFRLPDLYDTDEGEQQYGIGAFGVMGSGSWGMNPATDTYDGETPVLPSAWTQHKLQWVNTKAWGPIVSTGVNILSIQKPDIGIAHLRKDLESGAWSCSAHEYFLMQYRADVGYDQGLRRFLSAAETFTPGVLILHVDESQNTNAYNNRPLVDVEEANSLVVGGPNTPQSYNNHLWYQGNFTLFNHNSTPSSNAYYTTADSSVEIEVLSDYVTRLGEESVYINISSDCDLPRFTRVHF